LSSEIEKIGDQVIEDVATRLLSYVNHVDEIALALASTDKGEEMLTEPSYYRNFSLSSKVPRGAIKRQEAFLNFLRGNWNSVIERRLEYELTFDRENKSENLRSFLIILKYFNFQFYLKDGRGVGIDYVPRMLGINESWYLGIEDSFLHSSQFGCKEILAEHSSRFEHSFFKEQMIAGAGNLSSYANFGCNVVGAPIIEFFSNQDGNYYSNHKDYKEIESEICQFAEGLRLDGRFSLKEGLKFNVVWERKLPEMFYNLRFHTKKIRIYD